ncbi:glycosyltransferase family 4 protein [Mucilaginibacter sp. X4EP1]|uniref:glycosyltransferase family 4 protein n=1 Tax=Mucilaginibacter sp. X4EP1 TaxID=2723092 RepID=UPI0021699FAA|nr:glycosyltransferase family 4 protein [Mucilaginibacter sp. X4EP1]MCS3811716.1 glycosyltransferase involved in cell wall biosynthesis [Mucilaginibacter sp. X4EP1]
MNKSILFVSHDAELMGAPMVLLHLVRWVKLNTDYEVTVLLKAGGPLQTEFEALGEVYQWRPEQLSSSIGLRIKSKLNAVAGKPPVYIPFPPKLQKKQFGLVYLNTADVTGWAPMIKKMYRCPVIAHIHELSYSIKAYFPDAFNRENIDAIDHYIAASKSVADNLLLSYSLSKDKVSIFNEFIPVDEISKPTIDLATIKDELAIKGKFVVGASGQSGWRKGTDLFIRLAYLVNEKLPDNNIVFMWVGYQSHEAVAQAEYETDKLNLTGKVIFTGSKKNPQNYFQAFDVFTMMSREDPFPLVCLEAAALKKPVFCFKGSGGIPEIITDDIGAVFDYGDVAAMAEGIIAAYQQPDKTIKQGENAARMIRKYDVNIVAPQLFKVINQYAHNANNSFNK